MKNLALFLLLLAACAPAVKPTVAPSPKAIPTFADNLVTPLAAHEWSQSDPLITYAHGIGGLSQWAYWAMTYPMDFTLLPSGDLYLFRWNDNLRTHEILTTTLSQQATCNLLNSIDQAGFFDDWNHGGCAWRDDEGPSFLRVHDWRAKDAVFCEGIREQSSVPLSIRDIVGLLNQYQPLGTLHALKPERVGVWLKGLPISAMNNDFIEWPLKSYPLAAASTASASMGPRPTVAPGGRFGEPAMILTGADAAQAYDALGRINWGGRFRERDKVYDVLVRPLLPNEFNSSPLPRVSLSCSPSDGRIPAP